MPRPSGELRIGWQLHLSTQFSEAATVVANADAVVAPEVRSVLEVGRRTARELHELQISPSLALRPAAGLHAIWPRRRRCLRALEAE